MGGLGGRAGGWTSGRPPHALFCLPNHLHHHRRRRLAPPQGRKLPLHRFSLFPYDDETPAPIVEPNYYEHQRAKCAESKTEPKAEAAAGGSAEALVKQLKESEAVRLRVRVPPDAAKWLADNVVGQPATRTCKGVLNGFKNYARGIPAADKFCHGICDPRIPAKPALL